MSGSRGERLERLLKVQERKRQLDEWRLVELKREEAALAEANAQILESLGDQSLLNGLFLDAKANALRRNDLEAVANRQRQSVAAETLREAQGIEKRLERVAHDATETERRARESQDMALVLDDHVASLRARFE